jgi:hypothetical protein
MSFIRPELRAAILRWREALIGAAVLLLGVYWVLGVRPGLLTWIGYFGPLNGGLVDLDAMTSLSLDPTDHPRHWIITHEGGPALHIPVNAEGADVLFDAFASLPGLSPGRVAATLKHEGTGPIVLWRRADLQKRIQSLH